LIKWNDVWRLNINEGTIKKGDGEIWTKEDRGRTNFFERQYRLVFELSQTWLESGNHSFLGGYKTLQFFCILVMKMKCLELDLNLQLLLTILIIDVTHKRVSSLIVQCGIKMQTYIMMT
jgi:hypothetical protein